MNRLVIIGNGFDLAHGLKTSYKDFIGWYWEQRYLSLMEEKSRVSDDGLCRLEKRQDHRETWSELADQSGISECGNSKGVQRDIENVKRIYKITNGILLERITKNIETKGWTDIESDYYALLIQHANLIETCKQLNKQMDLLRAKLAEYLKQELEHHSNIGKIKYVAATVREYVSFSDIAQSSKKTIIQSDAGISEIMGVSRYMFLNFNYSATPLLYALSEREINYIHGSLDNPNGMIFGYGDELDEYFKGLVDRNENELLKNTKSIKYLETSHYRDLLSFIESGVFQVYIMGHSCGNSDRTLLNTIFEHPNCISIKPFCYINHKGEDNYSELSMNIYRNFSNKNLFRDRVVNKERCTTFEGKKLV